MTLKENRLHNQFIIFYLTDYGHVGCIILSGKVRRRYLFVFIIDVAMISTVTFLIDGFNNVCRFKGFSFVREMFKTVSYRVTVFSDMSL